MLGTRLSGLSNNSTLSILRQHGLSGAILTGIEHYSEVVEGLWNRAPVLPYIWANQFDAYSKSFSIANVPKIGGVLPLFDHSAGALRHDHNFQALLAVVLYQHSRIPPM